MQTLRRLAALCRPPRRPLCQHGTAIYPLLVLTVIALAGGTQGSRWRDYGPPVPTGVPSAGRRSHGESYAPSLSADGRYVAFASFASDLVGDDTNGTSDIFVFDRRTGTTERVSVASDGTQGNFDPSRTVQRDVGYGSWAPAIGADGRYVAFASDASNLVSNDTNDCRDIFVHDRRTGRTERVSVASNGAEGNGDSHYPAISGDGRYVAFASEAGDLVRNATNGGIFVHDRQTGKTTQVSVASDGTPGKSPSYFPAISADGRYVAFVSYANNLVKDDTNDALDVFVHDRRTGRTTRVSVASGGRQANANFQWSFVSAGDDEFPKTSYTSDSVRPAISAHGRYVAFVSDASNLVEGDRNGREDIFVHDRQTRRTERVRAPVGDAEGKARSYSPSISADGRYVAFQSRALKLEGAHGGLRGDIFVHDRWTGKTTRVSVPSDGTQGDYGDSYCPSLSRDGRSVAFGSSAAGDFGESNNIGYGDILVYDRRTRKADPVRTGKPGRPGPLYSGRESHHPSLSGDGRYVSFVSSASDLVTGDTNERQDIFVRDRHIRQTERVSVASDGTQGNGSSDSPAISADGRYVVFDSYASNLVPGDSNGGRDVFARDRQTGQTERVSVASDGAQGNRASHHPAISADGRYVAFASAATNLVPDDTNGRQDIFVHDRQTGTTTRVSITSGGAQVEDGDSYSPSLSADGRYVAFSSYASTLVAISNRNYGNIFLHDQQTGRTELISVASIGTGNAGRLGGYSPSLSADGQSVAFASFEKLVAEDRNEARDIFVRDRQRRQTELVSLASTGAEGNAGSGYPSLSGDGRYVAFVSSASSLVVGDTGGRRRVFVHDRQTGRTERVSVPGDSARSDSDSYSPSLSADGRYVAFTARSSGPVGGATKDASDVFVHDRQTGQTERVSVASDGLTAPNKRISAVRARGPCCPSEVRMIAVYIVSVGETNRGLS